MDRNERPENDILYGLHTVAAALANPKRKFVKLMATKNAAERIKDEIAAAGLTPVETSPRELDRIVGPEAVHQGMVLEAKPIRQPRLDQIPKEGVTVFLDQVTDPHNVGAILRSCAAFAVTALVTGPPRSPVPTGSRRRRSRGDPQRPR